MDSLSDSQKICWHCTTQGVIEPKFGSKIKNCVKIKKKILHVNSGSVFDQNLVIKWYLGKIVRSTRATWWCSWQGNPLFLKKKKKDTSSQLWHFSSALPNRKWFGSKADPKFKTTVSCQTLNIPEKSLRWSPFVLFQNSLPSTPSSHKQN